MPSVAAPLFFACRYLWSTYRRTDRPFCIEPNPWIAAHIRLCERRSLSAAVERIGSRIMQRKSVPSVRRLVAGADTKNATLVKSEGCISQSLVAAERLEPPTRGLWFCLRINSIKTVSWNNYSDLLISPHYYGGVSKLLCIIPLPKHKIT